MNQRFRVKVSFLLFFMAYFNSFVTACEERPSETPVTESSAQDPEKPMPKVTVIPVRQVEFQEKLVFGGILRPRGLREANSLVSGRLATIETKSGEEVTKGQLIATVVPQDVGGFRSHRVEAPAAGTLFLEPKFKRGSLVAANQAIAHVSTAGKGEFGLDFLVPISELTDLDEVKSWSTLLRGALISTVGLAVKSVEATSDLVDPITQTLQHTAKLSCKSERCRKSVRVGEFAKLLGVTSSRTSLAVPEELMSGLSASVFLVSAVSSADKMARLESITIQSSGAVKELKVAGEVERFVELLVKAPSQEDITSPPTETLQKISQQSFLVYRHDRRPSDGDLVLIENWSEHEELLKEIDPLTLPAEKALSQTTSKEVE